MAAPSPSAPQPATARAFAAEDVDVFQIARVRERLGPRGPRLPAVYAATLSPLAIAIAGSDEVCTFSIRDGRVAIEPGVDGFPTRIELARASFEGLTRDLESTAGLIYGRRAQAKSGDLMDFMQWEPALRWVYTGRPVYDPAAIDLRDRRGEPLDPTRSFRLDDDREEMAHFLRTTGFLFVSDVLSSDELARLGAEAERLRLEAREGDQESWWGRRDDGTTVLCRVLRAGKQPTMRSLHGDVGSRD